MPRNSWRRGTTRTSREAETGAERPLFLCVECLTFVRILGYTVGMSTQELLHQEVEELVQMYFIADLLDTSLEYTFKP